MTRLFRSAWVIGRRDFTATVFSKAFIFFLVGPLFPILLGIIFGGIGAQVATQTEQPRIAVIASVAEFHKLSSGLADLREATGDRSPVELVWIPPRGNAQVQTDQLLKSADARVIAVLTGGLDHPRLTGAVDRDGRTAGQVKILLTAARAAGTGARQLEIQTTVRSTVSLNRSRSFVAQAGQFLVFFLTLILGTMTLSQLIEEKSNKVIEVLAAAVPIEAVFLGKLFAMLLTSIVGIAVWTAAAAATVELLAGGGGGSIPTPAVGMAGFIALSVIYFAMNYLLLGSVFLSIGAQASTAREVQILSMPVTFAQVLIFGFASAAVGKPDSPVAIAGAVFPLTSPLVMIERAAERPELWTHFVAVLWQSVWIGLVIFASARLFRRTVLKSGPARRAWWRRAVA